MNEWQMSEWLVLHLDILKQDQTYPKGVWEDIFEMMLPGAVLSYFLICITITIIYFQNIYIMSKRNSYQLPIPSHFPPTHYS